MQDNRIIFMKDRYEIIDYGITKDENNPIIDIYAKSLNDFGE
jgi:hypothetical protein